MRPDPFASTLPGGGAEGPLLAVGTRLGRYVVEGKVGAGGMGVIYAARDPELDRRIALKLLREDDGSAADVDERRARLQREAQAMARLSHDNVITIYDVGVHEGRIFVAMELVAGTTLREWCAERRRGWREVLDVFLPAGRGLAAAHSGGIIHRDFKPDNVLVRDDGRVVVTDFGLARSAVQDRAPKGPADGPVARSPELTRTGALTGTPAYMAPEQFRGRGIDARSDQFSFCVALHEALYGERPFAPSPTSDLPLSEALGLEVLAGRLRPPPPTADAPAWLRRVLLRGLAVDPTARYPSMTELLIALEQGSRPSRLRRGVLTSAIAVGIAAAATVTIATRNRSGSTTGPTEKRVTRVAAESGVAAAAISPDGHRLAYAVPPDVIYVRDLDSGDERRLSLPQNGVVLRLSWFPTSDKLLVSMEKEDGQTSLLARSLSGHHIDDLGAGALGDVSPDGTQIACFLPDAQGPALAVRKVVGGETRVLARLPSSRTITSIEWSPTGERIAFQTEGPPAESRIETVAIDGGPTVPAVGHEPIMETITRRRTFAWMPDGRLVYHMVKQGRSELRAVRVDPVTGAAEPAVAYTPRFEEAHAGEMSEMSVSQGGQLAYIRTETMSHIYVGELRNGALSAVERLTRFGALYGHPSWTADSSALLFNRSTETDAQDSDIYRQTLAAEDAVLVARTSGADVRPLEWEGRGTLFISLDLEANVQRFAFAPFGSEKVRFMEPSNSANSDRKVDLSCKPRAGCVMSQYQEGASYELRSFDPETGPGRLIASIADWRPRLFDLSPDGKTIVMTGVMVGTGRRLRFVDVDSGHGRDLTVDGVDQLFSVAWSADGTSVYATDVTPQEGVIRMMRIALDGKHQVLRTSSDFINNVRPSPDGRRLAFVIYEDRSDVWLATGI